MSSTQLQVHSIQTLIQTFPAASDDESLEPTQNPLEPDSYDSSVSVANLDWSARTKRVVCEIFFRNNRPKWTAALEGCDSNLGLLSLFCGVELNAADVCGTFRRRKQN